MIANDIILKIGIFYYTVNSQSENKPLSSYVIKYIYKIKGKM